jgi:uncharacterized membrane protein
MIRWTLCSAIGVTVLIVGLGLVEPVAAQASREASKNVYTLTPNRFVASGAVASGLVGAVSGALALTRSGRTGVGRRRGIAALVLGPIAWVTGGLVVATADGGIGTGNGLAGGVVAIVLGLMGTSAGVLALVRARRIA